MADYYTLKDLHEITGYSDRTLRRYLAKGQLKGRKIGSEWRFTKDDVTALFEEIDFSKSVASLASEKVKMFLRGEYEKKGDHSMCTIWDFHDLTDDQVERIKHIVMRVSNQHKGIEMRFHQDNGNVRLSLIGDIDYIGDIMDDIRPVIKG